MSDVARTVRLPLGWRLWDHFALRGPGFPATGVRQLAPDGLATAADKLEGELTGPDWDGFTEAFDLAAVQTAERLQQIASDPAFRAAVTWQNPTVLRTGITPFLNWTPSAAGRTSMPRQREELVAHYWQRFCVKNDTIGFFGPVGWGRWQLDTRGVTVTPGTGLLASSHVYFASWAIDALAGVLDADPAVRAWMPPRRIPYARVAGDHVRLPGRPPQPIDPTARTVLLLCDGTRTPHEVAESAGLSLDRATAVIAELVRRRWARWRLEVPASTFPERELRARLDRIGDPAVRDGALAQLDRLERARDRVRDAGQDPDELGAALGALEAEFADLTDLAAQRAKGARTPPSRGLVYADCRRSATATLGTAVRDELAPLALCLTAARWLTNRFAATVGARIRAEYDRLATTGPVDLGSLWLACLPSPHAGAAADAAAAQAELRARWSRILDVPDGVRRVRRSSAELAAKVEAEFGGPGAAWSLARYMSPDVLVLAEDVAAVEHGDFELVLGEMHCAINTMAASLFVHQHPDQDRLLDETTLDFGGPRLLPMLPKELPLKWSARSRPALTRPEDYCVALADDTGDPNRPRTVLSADVSVEDRDGALVAVLPDGAVFNVLDAYANTLTHQIMDRFSLRPEGDHTPRIALDKMTVARETWRFPGAALAFAAEKTEAARFVRARQWRTEHELPRYVFVVSPTEPRPFYVDFDSPVSVTILAKAARRLARTDPEAKVTVSEMLPTPDQAWLTDDQGRTYTSELRFVAVDQSILEEA